MSASAPSPRAVRLGEGAALKRVSSTASALRGARADYDAAVLEAAQARIPQGRIAEAAGVTRQRINVLIARLRR